MLMLSLCSPDLAANVLRLRLRRTSVPGDRFCFTHQLSYTQLSMNTPSTCIASSFRLIKVDQFCTAMYMYCMYFHIRTSHHQYHHFHAQTVLQIRIYYLLLTTISRSSYPSPVCSHICRNGPSPQREQLVDHIIRRYLRPVLEQGRSQAWFSSDVQY